MLRRLASIILPAMLVGCGLGSTEGPADPSGRKRVSHATFADAAGQVRTLAEFNGKVVLIDVWATWCPPCRKSLPEIAALQKKGGDAFVVLAVSVDRGGWPEILPFLQANPGLGLEALVPGPGEGLEPFGAIPAIPTTLVVDRQGRLRERWSGYAPGRVEQALAAALKEP